MNHQTRVYNNVFEMMPDEENPSPMVRINRMTPLPDYQLFAKLEWFNPFGSIKDRPAWEMLRDLEKRGEVGGGRGVVAKVEVKGDKAKVTFKKEFEKQEQCTNWKSSNRITQITSSGSVIYESWCTASKSVTVDTSFPPQRVKARYVEGLKPGMAWSSTEEVGGVAYPNPGHRLARAAPSISRFAAGPPPGAKLHNARAR